MTNSSLSPESLDLILDAARDERVVVVPHAISSDAVGDDASLEDFAAGMPQAWTRGIDGAADTITTSAPAELGPVLPGSRDSATVTRLYHVQRSAQVRDLTDSVFDPLEARWSSDDPWLERDAGFFLTSVGAVTPAHADQHHNLLVQIRGVKEIGACPPGSRAHAATVARSHPRLYVDVMPAETQVIELPAGSAIYMPPYTLHWVRSLDASVALSCGWSTPRTVQAGRVHAANADMLRLRLPTTPVGARTDSVKVKAHAAARRLHALTRR